MLAGDLVTRAWARPLMLTLGTAIVTVVTGYTTAAFVGAAHVSQMLPWILGRGLGIAGYLSLFGLTVLGLWMRHPWRARWPHPAPDVQLRAHAALAAGTLVLIVGHIVALVLDPFAGVTVAGALAPGHASYRPLAVGLGTVAVYGGLLVGATAALAGWVGRAWRPIHAAAALVFAAVFSHGVLAGSDTTTMRPVYLVTAGFVAFLAMSRRLAKPLPSMATGGAG